MKSSLKSIVITTPKEVQLTNIESVVISNLSNETKSFVLNGIKRFLPSIHETFAIPQGQFVINSNYAFDVSLEFTDTNTNIVVDYLQLPKTQC